VLAAPAGEYARGLRPFGKAIQALSRPGVMRIALERALEQTFYDRTLVGHMTRRKILGARLAAPDFADFARAVARSVGGVLAAESQPLERIRQPVLAVWGREDRIVPMYRSAVLARAIPHAELRIVDRCGHIAMLEQPGEFNRHVAEFLASLDDARDDALGGLLMFQIDKPLPAVTEDGAPYWAAAREGALALQRCSACSTALPAERRLSQVPRRSSTSGRGLGRGTIYSFIVVHRPQHPGFCEGRAVQRRDRRARGGLRMHTNVVECATRT
jgi:hypothetical protein